MQTKLDKDIQTKIIKLIRDELNFVQLSNEPPEQLVEEIYLNMVTGLLLNEKEVSKVLNLLHHKINKIDSFKIDSLSASDLLKWAQEDEVREFLLRIIASQLLILLQVKRIQKEYEDSDCNGVEFAVNKNQIKSYYSQISFQQNENEIQQNESKCGSESSKKVQNRESIDEYVKKQDQEIYLNSIFENSEQIFKDSISEYFQKEQHSLLKELNKEKQQSNQKTKKEYKNDEVLPNQNYLSLPFSPHSPHLGIDSHQERRNSFDSNNDHSFSSQQQIKTLKMTDSRRPNEEEQLMSEVSSYNNQSQFVSASIYNVEDTSRYGHLLYGDKIDKILRSFISNSSIFLLVKWKPRSNGCLPMESILQSITVKEHSPQQLIEFYKSMSS